VTGFTDGVDKIDLIAFHVANAAAVLALVRGAPGGMVLDLTSVGGGTVFLAGFATSALDAGDLILG